MPKRLYLVAVSLLFSVPLAAQTSPSAEGPGISYWIGAAVSTFNPDYGCTNASPFSCWNHQVIGMGPYVDTSSIFFGRISAEGEARFLRWHGPADMSQDSYLAGPRVRLWRYRSLNFTGKILFGAARLTVPAPAVGTGTYFAYAPGAAFNYRFARRLSARIDYEYQSWPGFKGAKTGGGHGGLTPNGFTIGVAYALR
jgi:hypothetical protein